MSAESLSRRPRQARFPRIVENVAFVLFTVSGLFFILYGIFSGLDAKVAFGMACLGWAKAFEVSLRLRDHQEGRDA